MNPYAEPALNVADILPLAAHDFACYSLMTYPAYQLPRHIEALCSKLEAVECGRILRLMMFMPPRHGKSVTTSELFPSWYLGRNPSRSLILATYGQDLSSDFGRRVRNHVTDELQTAIFPECIVVGDSQDKLTFSKGGMFFAVGRGSAITGRGADLLLIDDPLADAMEARSEAVRKSLQERYSKTAFTRLSPGGAVVIISTRWHQDDLCGWLLSEHADEGWEVFSLPAIAGDDDPLGRKPSEALWPERYPLHVLEKARRQLGSAAFSALYQPQPVPEGGGIIKPHWFKFYVRSGDAVPEGCVILPEHFDQTAISMDLAFKASSTSDYVCMGAWGRKGAQKFLLDVVWDRFDFVQTKQAIRSLVTKYPEAHPLWIESAANGPAIISELRTSISGLIPVNAIGSKAARLSAASPDVESGCVLLPHPRICKWTRAFIDECAAACAGGKHDDAADMLSLAINQFRVSRFGQVSVSEFLL